MNQSANPQRRPSPPEHKWSMPTGLGQEPLNIVILGASFGGLSCAHHFLDYTINRLRITKAAPNYRLIIVNPSTHLYWNVAAPRALVSPDLLKNEGLFVEIEQGFHRHRGHQFSIVQGEAVAIDASARTVTVELIGSTAKKRASQINKRASRVSTQLLRAQDGDPKVQTIAYHALIMATGSSAHSDLLGLHGPHLNTLGALNAFHARVAAAKSIVICGVGCSGVEVAGQLATFLNCSSHWPMRRRVKNPKEIILIAGGERCLPKLEPKVGLKAEKLLRKLGVEIRHKVRVLAAKRGSDVTRQTRVQLSDKTCILADLYIACTGVSPNTAYVPQEWKDEKGYIATNTSSMRLDHPLAGARTYAIGDVASYSNNTILDVYAAVPVIMHNLLNDLLAHEYHLASPYGGNQDKIDELVDERYVVPQQHHGANTQLCPITRFGGVGVLAGVQIPGLLVWALKGRRYRVSKARKVVVDGGNPYDVTGKYE